MRLFLLTFFMMIFCLPATAAEQIKHAHVRLYSPVTATGTAATVPVAVEITLDPGWHAYWRTPGDAGLAPVFTWAGSQNFQDATVLWPTPHRFVTADLDNYGYKDSVTFPMNIAVTEIGAALNLTLKAELLICSDICVPETHQTIFSLPAGEAKTSADGANYEIALSYLPKPDNADIRFEKAWLSYDRDNQTYLMITAAAAQQPVNADIFVENTEEVVFSKPDVQYDAERQKVLFRTLAHTTQPLDQLNKALQTSTLRLTYSDTSGSFEQEVSLSEAPVGAESITPSPIAEKVEGIDFRILALALLGGLILNLMPCVLPVLSLKVLSVVSHGGKESNRRTIFKNFMASAVGILFSFWLMAAALASLKSAGESIGWGIQFQHPVFLIFLIAVLLGFAANMLDLFEIPLPRFIAKHASKRNEHEPTLIGHFLTGAFATLLATPCTAPFLGTAIGFALARGTYEIFVTFTFLGIGLALPYILLALSPGLFRLMPRPGKWMMTLKRILAAALLITAGWLVSILLTITTAATLDAGWEKFDTALIAPAVSDGKTVVVDVTADWCLTCKANKKLVLETAEVQEALSVSNILRLQADWTNRDEAIAAYLQSFGKYGIPFNVVYGPGAPEGIVLPELLTQDDIMSALAEAAGE
jgi:suppressor for copper-sensitivity B